MPEFRIVIPTYNRRHILELTIPHYRALGAPLLVVDDGSTDGTAEWLRTLGVPLIRHPHRRGLPAARNTGLRSVDAPWVLFGEDDVLFAPGHAEALLHEARRLPRCAAVAGLLFTGHAWEPPLVRPPWEGDVRFEPVYLSGSFAAPLDRATPLPSVHACGLIDRRAALSIGGYDETFTDSSFREESDFYARLWHAGRSVWQTPATWAVHVRHRLGGGCRGRTGIIAKAANRWSYWRNNARFLDRHGRMWKRWLPLADPGTMKWHFARRLVAQQLAALRR